MPDTTPTLDALLAFALDAAWQAGRVTLGHYQTGLAAERKADNSPVTLADRQAEQKLRDLITTAWPDHALIGEEYGHQPGRGDSGYTWIIDPIDGTKSFISGVPFYAVLLASDLDTFARFNRQDAFQRLIDATYFQRTWGDAYGYALVATGRAEIMLDPVMAVWDCGPLQVILEEAGGTFTDWRGTPTIFGGEAVATNGALFEPVMELIQ